MPFKPQIAALILASFLVAALSSCSSPAATPPSRPSPSAKPSVQISSVTNGRMSFAFTPDLLKQMNQTTSPVPLDFVIHGQATEGQDASLAVPVVGGSVSYYAPGHGLSHPEARGTILTKDSGLNMYNSQGGLIVDNFEAHLGVDPYISADIDPLGKAGSTLQQVPFLRLDPSALGATGASQAAGTVTLKYGKARLASQAVAFLNKTLKRNYFRESGDFGAVTLQVHP